MLVMTPAGLGHSPAADTMVVLAMLILPAAASLCGVAGIATRTRSGYLAGFCAAVTVLVLYVLVETAKVRT
jgi:hypothetical protein